MATFQQYYDWANEPAVWQRVAAAAVQQAITVMAESDTVTGHVQRAALASLVLESPQQWGRLIALGLLVANEPADPNVPDAALSTAVAAVWNAYAGVG